MCAPGVDEMRKCLIGNIKKKKKEFTSKGQLLAIGP